MIKEIVKIWPFYLAFILLVIATSHNCFFWDTVLVPSCQASWYYGNHFSHFFLPDSINPGHPPFFPMYLAFAWTLFGRTLLVSHLAMLPFVLGIVFQANKLVSFYFSDKNRTIALMLLLADATLLSQCTLVSPDVILVLGFLTALNGLLYQKRWGIVLGSSMLVMISQRGMILVAALFLFDLITHLNREEGKVKTILRRLVSFLPSGFIGIGFLLIHFLEKNYIGYKPGSPWSSATEIVPFARMIHNFAVLCWRMLDFGRIWIWIGLLIATAYMFRKKIRPDQKTKPLLILFMLLFLALFPLFTITRGLSQHRYLLVMYLVTALLFCIVYFENIPDFKFKRSLAWFVLAGLLSGNLWIYPTNISMGWDSTLAHLPYYSLRSEMIRYIDEHKIPVESVNSSFPNLYSFHLTDLKQNDHRRFTDKQEGTKAYLFYSNVFNDFNNDEIQQLTTDYKLLKEFRKNRMYVRLYKRIR